MDDQALFNAAIATEAPAEVAAPATEQGQPDTQAQPRDDSGRFAPKGADAAPAGNDPSHSQTITDPGHAGPSTLVKLAPAEARQEPPPGWIPAWRAREIADVRTQKLEAELRKYTEKPAEEIDPYVDPAKFRDVGVRQAIDPIAKQMAETREYFSRKDAIRQHGLETVQAAYTWLEQATHAGDPRVAPLLQRVTQSIDPFEEVVTAFKRDKALATVGDDPNAWFEKELEKRMADPAFAAKYQAQSAQQANAQGAPKTVFALPPSVNRATGSAQAPANATMNDSDLFAHALK